jgi:hypothetical protein
MAAIPKNKTKIDLQTFINNYLSQSKVKKFKTFGFVNLKTWLKTALQIDLSLTPCQIGF